jgi:hypothetical protein
MENPKEVELSNLWIMCPGGVFKVMNVISSGGYVRALVSSSEHGFRRSIGGSIDYRALRES